MRINYQLLNPVLLIISIGLVAYLVYLLSLTITGSHLRMIDNIILILVIIVAVLIIIILIRQGTKVQEKLERVSRKKGSSVRTVIRHELPYHILKELDKIIMGGKEREAKPKEKEETPIIKKPEEEKEAKAEKKPAKPHEEIPETVGEKLEEISGLLREGAKLKDTDVRGAKEAFLRIKEIYNSLSPGEKKLIDNEIAKAMKSHEETAKKPIEEKK